MITLKQVSKELDIHFKRIDTLLPELESYMPILYLNQFEIH